MSAAEDGIYVYCPRCGGPADDQATVCNKCGTLLFKPKPDVSPPVPLQTLEYAGFWKRLGAYFIDQIVMQIPYTLSIPFIIVAGIFMPESWVRTAMIFAFMIGYLAAYLLYGPLMESSRRQATLGKQALGILVTDMEGNRVSFARALGRNAGKIVSAIIYYAGFFMVAFTQKKQGLHDIMAGCLVVKKKEVAQQ